MSITFLFDFTKTWSEILIAYTKPYPICLPSFTSLRSVTVGSEGLGEASVYLSVKQIVTKVFAELVTPVPPKTIAF